jgi:hypothetical protein
MQIGFLQQSEAVPRMPAIQALFDQPISRSVIVDRLDLSTHCVYIEPVETEPADLR